jgi:basic membrane protein A and related proteins
MSTSRYAAAVLSAGALVLAACQPAQQAAPTAPAPAATTAPAAAKPSAAASAAASPAASPAVAASPSAAASPAAAAPSPAAKPAASPVASPSAVAAAQPAAAAAPPDPGCPNSPVAGGKQLRVGLVTDVGKVDDRSFNQSAWEGVQCAQKNLGITDIKFIETTASTDYGPNIDQFAQDNYDVIVTVGFLLSPATVAAAQKYPNIKFIGVDQFQDATVPNLAGLVFDEDKSGYLAGYLAGSLDTTGTVGMVLGLPQVPAVEKYGVGYVNGAKAAKPAIHVLSACGTSFTDTVWGNTTANQEMSQNADLIFAAAGLTGNGALLAVADKGGSVLGIGVDTDQYLSLPEAKNIMVSSAMKLIVPGVFNLIKGAQANTFKGGNVTGDVGLAPYHDLDAKVPADVKTKMNQLTADIASGRTKTGFTTPVGTCPPSS